MTGIRAPKLIQELSKEVNRAKIFYARLAEPYDGIGQYVLVDLSKGSVAAVYKARVASGDFNSGRIFPVGTLVSVHISRGQLEILSLGAGRSEVAESVSIFCSASDQFIETSSAWKVTLTGTPPAGWHIAGFDDSSYAYAMHVGLGGEGVWYDSASSRWIWDDEATGTPKAQGSGEERSFRHEFQLLELPASATLEVVADNGCIVYINGTQVGTVGLSERGTTDSAPFNYVSLVTFSVDTGLFIVGTNCISIIGWNETNAAPGPAGVYAVLTVATSELLGSDPCAARGDHSHVHNSLAGRDAPSTHPAAAISDSGGSTVQAALDTLRSTAWKQSVRVATTVAGTLASSFENGDTVDGVVLATGNRILIKDQASGAENGIYVVNASGAPTRATDMDVSAEVLGAVVLVEEGTANADKIFRCTNNATIVLGTTALVFTEIGGGTIDYAEDVDISTQAFGDTPSAGASVVEVAGANHKHGMPANPFVEGASSKASGTGDVTITGTLQDLTGATLSLGAGTYIVTGVFDVRVNNTSNDRLFEGHLDVNGTDENDIAVLQGLGLDDTDRQTIVQQWRVTLSATQTVKLRGKYSGGATGDFTALGANTTIVAYRVGMSFGQLLHIIPTTGFVHGIFATVGAANNALFRPVRVPTRCTVTGVRVNIGTSSGNIDVGLYDASLNRLASSGSVASPGTGLRTINFSSSVVVDPGDYYLAVASSNNTVTFSSLPGTTNQIPGNGFSQGTAFPLPNPASLGTELGSNSNAPNLMGIVTGGWP